MSEWSGSQPSPTVSGIYVSDPSFVPNITVEEGCSESVLGDDGLLQGLLNAEVTIASDAEGGGELARGAMDSPTREGMRRRRRGVDVDPANLDEPPDHPMTLEERHQRVNRLFGYRPWKGHVSKRALEERSATVQSLYSQEQIHGRPGLRMPLVTLGNVFWSVGFGWWLAAAYFAVGGFMLCTVIGKDYAFHCFQLARYFFFPFGKHLERVSVGTFPERGESRRLLESKRRFTEEDYRASPPRKGIRFLAAILWYLVAAPALSLAHFMAFVACWFSVFMIPMAKINRESVKFLYRRPLTIAYRKGDPDIRGNTVLCTYIAVNRYYYKYSVFGMNVMLVNMIPFILFTVIWGYSVPDSVPQPLRCPPLLMFVLCLLCVIPLAYYIGAAISSISAQSTFAVGAILNATFGSMIELILYFFALRKGLAALVTSAVTGSLLGTMLLLPGLSMIFGGFKYKEQRFNQNAAGVSSVLLFVSIIGAFTPTIFYQVYGSYDLTCDACDHINATDAKLNCAMCHLTELNNLDDDPRYKHHARWLMYTCAGVLPIAYAIGLIFTLKTHSFMWDEAYWKKDEDEAGGGGHSGPEWGKIRCIFVLLTSTILFALLAEKLVQSIEPTLELIGLSEGFVGLTIIALVPNTAEFVNAIQFALQNNISLSIEIGSSAAVQISLIQIPVLVLLSLIVNNLRSLNSFTLIFPTLDLFSVVFSVIILNYISVDGRSNYFEGASLVLVWALLVSAFFWMPE